MREPRSSLGMTPGRTTALQAIAESIAKRGCSPSFEELRPILRCTSLATVHQTVRVLEREGMIRRAKKADKIARSLQLTKRGKDFLSNLGCCEKCGRPYEGNV